MWQFVLLSANDCAMCWLANKTKKKCSQKRSNFLPCWGLLQLRYHPPGKAYDGHTPTFDIWLWWILSCWDLKQQKMLKLEIKLSFRKWILSCLLWCDVITWTQRCYFFRGRWVSISFIIGWRVTSASWTLLYHSIQLGGCYYSNFCPWEIDGVSSVSVQRLKCMCHTFNLWDLRPLIYVNIR